MSPTPAAGDRDNFVFLRGRLAQSPTERELPSGDVLATFRVTVPRPPGGRVLVDSIECSTVKPKVHKTLTRADPGTEIEVCGTLQRRFWRGPAGPASRYAVDVDTIRLVRTGPRAAAARGRTPASG